MVNGICVLWLICLCVDEWLNTPQGNIGERVTEFSRWNEWLRPEKEKWLTWIHPPGQKEERRWNLATNSQSLVVYMSTTSVEATSSFKNNNIPVTTVIVNIYWIVLYVYIHQILTILRDTNHDYFHLRVGNWGTLPDILDLGSIWLRVPCLWPWSHSPSCLACQ